MNIKKALVVDDSKVAHLTLRKLLLERTIEVDWVGSGEDCIKYLDNKTPDIIFMDVMMPGMDGFETTRAITSQNPSNPLPVIMCSANATDEDKRDAKESGAVSFLSKPYTPDQLDAILQSISQGTAAIAIDETAAAMPAVPPPAIVEKTLEISIPSIPIQPPPTLPPTPPIPAVAPAIEPPAPAAEISVPVAAETPAPVAETPAPATAMPAPVSAAAINASEIEQIAERAAWAAAEKVTRDIIQELVPGLATEAANQTARNVSEDLGRRAAHAAVRAAQEAAKQVATEIARGTAERTARSTAQESARVVVEQATRQVNESVSQRNIGDQMAMNRDELLKEIETQVSQHSKSALADLTATPEFKQQITQMVRSGIQPVVETIARETSERAIEKATANFAGEPQGVGKGGNMALIIGGIALVVAAVALLGQLLKLF